MLELILQVSQVVEDSSTSCSVPTRTYRIWTQGFGWEEKEEEKEEEDGGHND